MTALEILNANITRLMGDRTEAEVIQASKNANGSLARTTFNRIRRGKSEPTFRQLDEISKALGVPACELLREPDPVAATPWAPPSVVRLFADLARVLAVKDPRARKTIKTAVLDLIDSPSDPEGPLKMVRLVMEEPELTLNPQAAPPEPAPDTKWRTFVTQYVSEHPTLHDNFTLDDLIATADAFAVAATPATDKPQAKRRLPPS